MTIRFPRIMLDIFLPVPSFCLYHLPVHVVRKEIVDAFGHTTDTVRS